MTSAALCGAALCVPGLHPERAPVRDCDKSIIGLCYTSIYIQTKCSPVALQVLPR